MRRTSQPPVSRFLDIEAKVGDTDDEDEEKVEMDNGAPAPVFVILIHYSQLCLDGFIEDEHIDDAGNKPWKRFFDENVDSNSDRGWTDLMSSLEERYGPRDDVPCVAENNYAITRPLGTHPGISTALNNISRSPTEADYPLWRIRCRVTLDSGSFCVSNLFFSRWEWKRKLCFSCFR
jgi:hypothetical protein